jgi:diaminopimelate decarboxylase
LCREEDILHKRKLTFSTVPAPGDIICFLNTAAYASDFEDASPHQHPRGKRFVAVKKEGSWNIMHE